MALGQAIKQVAGDVADTAKSAVASSAKQIAKTPLDLLEEMLGQAPGKPAAEAEKPESGGEGSGASVNPEELKQREAADNEFKKTEETRLLQEINQSSASYYKEQKAMAAQKKQQEEQAQEARKFQIENLEKRKTEDFALKAAQDAANAEKRVGAG